jgi:metal-responsive CopG/Arc/MetJ family transcriptional regulator
MVKELKPQKESKVALEIEISNIMRDRVDEILETSEFTNVSELINHAILHFIPEYERSRNEYLSDKLGELEQYL